jgi:hypothetical protein
VFSENLAGDPVHESQWQREQHERQAELRKNYSTASSVDLPRIEISNEGGRLVAKVTEKQFDLGPQQEAVTPPETSLSLETGVPPIEILPNVISETVGSDGSRVRKYDNGTTETVTRDGDRLTHYNPPKGGLISGEIKHADGTFEVHYWDGGRDIIHPDGRKVTESPPDKDGRRTIATFHPDGSAVWQYPDGSTTTVNSDGTRVDDWTVKKRVEEAGKTIEKKVVQPLAEKLEEKWNDVREFFGF